MERQALGLIETVGLIGAIEAADAAAKAAAVRLVQSEVTDGTLVTVHIEGELGAVQAAVDAGVAACQKVGQLLSHVVIPRPDSGLDAILDHPTRVLGAKKRGNPAGSAAPRQSPPRQPTAPVLRTAGPTGTVAGPDYATMTVAGLRRLARRRGDVDISGRDLARADKDLLVRLLLEADTRRGTDRR